jgi:ribosomal protein S6
MRSYELILVIKSSLTDAVRKKLIAGIKSLLKDLKVSDEKEVGKKTLAHTIKKETTGVYLSLELEGESIPQGFEKRLIENDDVLRHLLLRKN